MSKKGGCYRYTQKDGTVHAPVHIRERKKKESWIGTMYGNRHAHKHTKREKRPHMQAFFDCIVVGFETLNSLKRCIVFSDALPSRDKIRCIGDV